MSAAESNAEKAAPTNGDGARYAVREDLLLEEVDGELLILDLDDNVFFGLDEVGRMIWRALEAGQTLGEIVDRIVARWDVTSDEALEDARAFIDELVERDLLRRA